MTALLALSPAVGTPPLLPQHGIGGRQDLPLPFGLALAGSALILLVTFAGLAVLWRRPRLSRPESGAALPDALTRAVDSPVTRVVLQVMGLVVAAYVTVAAVGGANDALNPTAGAVYVLFWVGVPFLSVLVGPWWRRVNPLRTLHRLLARAAGRDPRAGRPYPPRLGLWPAALGLVGFGWLELACPPDLRTSTTVLTAVFAGYAAVMLAGAAVFGELWFDRADAFDVWFTLVARVSPLSRRADGRIVVRNPLSRLALTPVLPGLGAVLVASLGTTAFDGYSRTDTWARLTQAPGRNGTLLGTAGLAAALLVVAASYAAATGASRSDGPSRFAPSMLPIAVGYLVAHYFSLLVFEGQRTFILLSDPLSTGANLLGTAGSTVDYALLPVSAIALIRALAVVVGHVVGVFVAHDRALEDLEEGGSAVATQLPLLLTMVGYTLAALLVLLR